MNKLKDKPKEEVEKIVPNNLMNHRIFFLKILISKLDRDVLSELQVDIADDFISSTYDKILEGLSLRFEKLHEFQFQYFDEVLLTSFRHLL